MKPDEIKEVEVTDIEKFDGRSDPQEMPVVQQSFMDVAVQKNYSLEDIEKMMALEAKRDERLAKKAYVQAMSDFKKNPPKIMKDQLVKYQNRDETWTEYKHANLAVVAQEIGKGLAEHGLFAAWIPKQSEGGLISLTCTITHKDGHSESAQLAASPDQSGGKNNIQAIGSTISYLERYTILSLTGLATHEMDNDGRGNTPNGQTIPKITEEQLADLKAYCESLSLPADMTLQTIAESAYTLKKIEDLRADWYENCIGWIDNAAKPAK